MRHLPTLMIVVLLAVSLVVPLATPGARAASTIGWNSTPGFDSGTKAKVSTQTNICENVTANAIGLNNTGNYQGIGLTTGTLTCPTGAWGVSASGLDASWDLGTLNGSNLRDFSGNGRDLIKTGTPPSLTVTSPFGKGQNQTSLSDKMTPSKWFGFNGSTAQSVFVWVIVANCSNGKTVSTVVNAHGSGTDAQGTLRLICSTSGGIPTKMEVLIKTTVTGFLQMGPTYSFKNWTQYRLGYTWDGATLREFINGVNLYNATLIGSVVSSIHPLTVGNYYGGDSPFHGVIDEVAIWSRGLTSAEVTAWITDGRSSFLSSGSWQSPSISFTQVPNQAEIIYTNGRSYQYPNRMTIYAGSGAVLFDTILPLSNGGVITIPVNLTFQTTSWTVKVNMIGAGNGTAFMTSITFSLGPPPTLDANAMIFIAGLILMLVLGLGGLVIQDGIPALSIFGGLVGVMFGFWLWTQTAQPWLLLILVFLGILFMFMGAFMAFQDAGGG